MRTIGAEIASAGGIKLPMGFGFRPEVDFGVMVVRLAGEEVAVVNFFEIQRSEEAG